MTAIEQETSLLKTIFAGAVFVLFATSVSAAAPAAKDDWVAQRNSMEIKAPVEKVWGVIGGYCEMPRVMKASCSYTQGTGGLGTIRLMNGSGEALKVGEGHYNYSFFYTAGPHNEPRYHGNLELAASADNKTTNLIYTLIYDQSVFASDAERAAQKAVNDDSFGRHFNPVKVLAEK